MKVDLQTIGSICSIVSFLLTVFITTKIFKIEFNLKDTSNTKSKQSKNIVGRDMAGRDIAK